MPAVSEKQRRLMGAALSMKRGESKMKGGAAKVSVGMSEKSLREFAREKASKEI